MAVQRMNEKATLSITFITGLVNGKETYASASYAGVKPDATDAKVYDVALAFGGLSENFIKNIFLRETTELVE